MLAMRGGTTPKGARRARRYLTTSVRPAAVQILLIRVLSSVNTRVLAEGPRASCKVETELSSSSAVLPPASVGRPRNRAACTETARSSTTPRRRLLPGLPGRPQMRRARSQCAAATSSSPNAPQTMPRLASVRQSSWWSKPKCCSLMAKLRVSSSHIRFRSPSSPQANAKLLSVMAVSTWPLPKCRSSMSRLHSKNSRALGTSPSSP
mmetsp:Transcript_122883/g.342439  ORF Transcript_122883/g.342439 Transcript_122883/m.342439 type:complete len:207 (+) Transcript_122883:205-825(+)